MLAMWDWKRWVVFLLPIGMLVLGAVGLYLMRKTIRSRMRMDKQLRLDPDINEWLVIFGWSRKALYIPTIVLSLVAALLSAILHDKYQHAIGGVWMSVFFLNFLIDEYELSIKVLLIIILCVVAGYIWLLFMGWEHHALTFFRKINVSLNWMGYLLIALILALAVVVSWIKGLFYYVAITPNYLNIQVGPTETGEQISREEYSTRVDTGDFLERLLGFGRVIITFSDQRRQPIALLIGRIGKRAAKLESIRGILAVDRHQGYHEPHGGSSSSNQ
jgi:hypothetical protein